MVLQKTKAKQKILAIMHNNLNYAHRKLAMECVSMSENTAYYSCCIFYKLHK